MSKASSESLQGQYSFTGRTIGKMLRKRRGGGNPSSEHRPLRRKIQVQPRGKNRFPEGFKYRHCGEWQIVDGKERYIPGPPVPGC